MTHSLDATKQAVVKITESYRSYEGGELMQLSLSKIDPLTNPQPEPFKMTFAKPVDVQVILSRYDTGNITVTCSLMVLHGIDTVGLTFEVGESKMRSHGVLLGHQITGIPTDHEGNAIALTHKLPKSFESWVRNLENLSWV